MLAAGAAVFRARGPRGRGEGDPRVMASRSPEVGSPFPISVSCTQTARAQSVVQLLALCGLEAEDGGQKAEGRGEGSALPQGVSPPLLMRALCSHTSVMPAPWALLRITQMTNQPRGAILVCGRPTLATVLRAGCPTSRFRRRPRRQMGLAPKPRSSACLPPGSRESVSPWVTWQVGGSSRRSVYAVPGSRQTHAHLAGASPLLTRGEVGGVPRNGCPGPGKPASPGDSSRDRGEDVPGPVFSLAPRSPLCVNSAISWGWGLGVWTAVWRGPKVGPGLCQSGRLCPVSGPADREPWGTGGGRQISL